MTKARLADGTILEFPDGTDPAVMEKAVKDYISGQGGDAPALAQQEQLLSPSDAPGFGTSILRGGEAFSEGVWDSLAGAAGALPELTSWAGRKIPGVRDYMPESGFYPGKIKEAVTGVGEFVSAPFNRALGYIDPEGEPTGTWGPSGPQGTMEEVLRGTGEGVGMVAPFLGVANLLNLGAKSGSVAQQIGKTMAAQPGIQFASGGVGGATTELTDNAWLGLVAALGTGVGLSVMANKLAQHGATTRAEKKIMQLIRELGDGDEAAGFREVQKRLAAGGDDTALVDTLDIQGAKMGRASANVPEGQGPVIADEFVQTRTGGRGERLQKAADTLARNEYYPLLERLNLKQRTESKPLYDKAFAPRSDPEGKVFAPWDDRLQRFLDHPKIQKAMAKGIAIQKELAIADDIPFNYQEYSIKGIGKTGELIFDKTPNLRAMDAAKQGLDAEIYNPKNMDAFGNMQWTPALRATEKLRNALVTKLDDITTDPITKVSSYQKARAAWSGPQNLSEAATRGRNFIKGDEELAAKAVVAMSEGEREAFRIGARREISRLINDDTQTALTKFATKKATFWNKLRTVFPDEKSFNIFVADIEKELSKGRVEAFAGPRAGSQTAGLQQDIAELTRMPESASRGLEAGGQLLSGHPLRFAGVVARPALDWVKRPSSKTAEGLARYLFELDPAKQRTMLKALQGAATTKAHNLDMVQALMGTIAAEQTPYEALGN